MDNSNSALNIQNHVALTSDMNLGLKPSAPRSRAYRVNIAPNNKQVFGSTDVIYIDIPTSRPNTWYDPSQSYLKFSVQCAATGAVAQGAVDGIYVDNSAYSFISRLDVYHGSNLLETISQYGALCNTILDSTLTQADKSGLSSMMGINPLSTGCCGSGAAFVANTFLPSLYSQTPGDRTGLALRAVQGAANINTAFCQTFCLPLMSGVVGVNASKMIPVGNLRAPISLQIYTAANDDAIYYATAGAGATWQIVNVEFVATYVEIQDDNFGQHFDPSIPQYISTRSWRESSFSVGAGLTGEITNLLSFRMASITNILGRFRNQAGAVQGANATCAYRLSSAINPNIAYYYFKLGSQIVPNKQIQLYNNGTLVGSGSESFAELQKSFHALDTMHGNSAVTYNQYNVASVANAGWLACYPVNTLKANGQLDTSNNSFCIGQELESFCHKGDTILSGISSLNTNLFFTFGIIPGAGNVTTACIAEFYCQFDMILCIQDGYITARY